MGAGEIGGRSERSARAGARLRKGRLGIRIDMTPMVDVAFLLLIFFMVTTVFRAPQALEVNLPPKNVVTPATHILTLRVLPGEKMYWNVGTEKPRSFTLAALPHVIEEAARNRRLVVLVKIDEEAPFHSMVDVIDELDRAKVTRFSMAPLSGEDKREVETL